jgi:thiol-disulfide isomerase/thioredoxin
MTDQPQLSPKRHRRRWVAAVLLAAAAAVVAVYGIGTQWRNPADAACRPAVELAQRLAPLARGEVAAVAVAERPLRLPNLAFNDADGKAHTLSDWQGRVVLFNLWATWCVPCRKEMPALDELEAKLGGQNFEVVAVNIDTRDANKPRAWLRDAGIARLAYYTDPSAKVFQDLKLIGKAIGMPTTLLVDPAGCEIATIAGPAEWASADGVRLVSAALGK